MKILEIDKDQLNKLFESIKEPCDISKTETKTVNVIDELKDLKGIAHAGYYAAENDSTLEDLFELIGEKLKVIILFMERDQ